MGEIGGDLAKSACAASARITPHTPNHLERTAKGGYCLLVQDLAHELATADLTWRAPQLVLERMQTGLAMLNVCQHTAIGSLSISLPAPLALQLGCRA